MTIGDAYERMLQAMEDVTGEALETAHPRRTESQYWMRTIIAQHLWKMGWNDRQIGEILHRDHSTIFVARAKYRAAMELPKIYADVVRLTNNFKQRYYDFFGTDI